MKISEQWLREWVDPPLDSAGIAEQLTLAGLEVDRTDRVDPGFSGVVAARVLTLEPHPEAERLQVARVDVGDGQPRQIVCGAPNIAVGQHVPAALPGAVLPGEVRIDDTRLRGVDSQGMLCSARELGLGERGDGLLVLPPDSPPGQNLQQLLRLDDTVIEIDLTPNRGDCLSVAGIAREVGVLNHCDLTPVPIPPVAPECDDTFPVSLADPDACPRYVGRVIQGVDPGAATPLWLSERLRRCGVRSLGPLVDVTNYVMLELGQPMHAFDLGKLREGIVVRRARAGERLALLNEQTVTPDPDTLLITDGSGPIALAGIMGGASTECDDDTRDVFLESAFFSPAGIAGRARRFGLHTDASHRFERGVDPELQARAVERATRLLVNIAGGRPGPLIDVTAPDHLPQPASVRLRAARLHQLLGVRIEADEVEDSLRRLGMTVAPATDGWEVTAPPSRFDIALEVDLIEEVGR
ncbi:MAG: phenylalanine--tRNA ligase subunit beta, partial [Candidatus Competibacterales bacterium]|nr:phenylalanine--tRNA ligase subunit beta [Candidatus Competibacterales bacterium]